MGFPRSYKDRGKLRPGIGGGHIDDADGLDPLPRRIDPEKTRGLATLDTAPEFALGSDDQVLVERIGMGLDLDPFAAPGNDREHGGARGHHPHIVLQLWCVFFHRRFLGEIPRQHELGLEHRLTALDAAIKSSRHPPQHRMAHSPLDVSNRLAGIGLIPAPIEVLGHHPKLHHQIAGQILWLDLAPLLPPESDQRLLIIAHDDPGVGAPYKGFARPEPSCVDI
jgi:hypothetical protein